ncbi:hypothetical protein A3709_05575 [Halioglobus sp. HI00S01]|uniref:hypothetical protein n=1 Tax=Halioglobus sp. HI00S01 TaxID=1822214 RepID=UPI0007C2E919|nr:hypothetical protein [Halioglobus sp. HI00S01]KZX56568.1 hypothetical protein A3709_05575 [Halioglobus sp. HI00S01]
MNAYSLAVLSAGTFFLTALLCGVWKYVQMVDSETGQAHFYVDTAHRASLMYAFACVLIAAFVNISQLGATLELVATALLVIYFGIAILTYILQGFKAETDNQVHRASGAVRVFMWTLIGAEIGGFLILFYGVITALL